MAGTVTFHPEARDYVAVARGSFGRSLRRRRFLIRAAIVLMIGVFGGIALNGGPGEVGGLQAAVLGLAAGALWLATILVGTYLLIPRRTTRLFRQQRTLEGRFDFTWSDAGVGFGSDTGRSDLSWSQYHGWFEDERVFAFGLNEQLFHWVPTRAMAPGDAADLRLTVHASGLRHL